MKALELTSLMPLSIAAGYTLLLILSFARRSQRATLTRWFLGFLVLSIVWEFLILMAPEIHDLADFPIKALVVTTTFIGVTSAIYEDWPQRNRWLFVGGTLLLVSILVDLLIPDEGFSFSRFGSPRITYSSFISHFFWLVLSTYILYRSWREYRRTRFPWHANRLLFWLIILLLTFTGEALLVFRWTGLSLTGQAIRFIGVAGMAYAISSHRLFDVRTNSQSALLFVIVTLISGFPLFGGIFLTQWLARNESTGTIILLTIAAITVGLLLFQRLRRSVERIVFRYFLGEGIDTRKVVREYSQAIYRTLDVAQLAEVITSTIGKLLGTDHGILILVTEDQNDLMLEPVATQDQVSRPKFRLPATSPLAGSLARHHQPVLQYEIDFDPDFADTSDQERSWLHTMAMEVYVPISTGQEITGLIAVGPRGTGVPYQPHELELVQILADQTVVALQNSRLYSELATQNEKIRQLNVDLINQNERLEIMDRVKSDFIAIASHELRTPLTQVRGYADILDAMNEEKTLTVEQTRGIVGHINHASERLETLIAAMLDASELDLDGMRLSFAQTSLPVILQAAMNPLVPAIEERRISVSVKGTKSLPLLFADEKRLVQAFANLIGNAVKYTPDRGSITLQTSVAPSREPSDTCLEVTISDTGIGIDPEFHELIFEKFFRVEDPQLHSTGDTKYKGAGPGLGLAIAKGVIEAHGGHIWVESDGEDEARLPGSRFHVMLPVRPPNMKLGLEAEAIPRPT